MSDAKIEMKDMTRDICCIIDKLSAGLLNDVGNPHNASVEEAGAIADMIKDMCEAKEKLVKAKYYESIVEAMKDSEYGEDYDENGRMGYRGRNRRTGRYTSMGYPLYHEDDIMGYNGVNRTIYNRTSDNQRMGYRYDDEPSRHGAAFDKYKMARRYYTENPTGEMKMQMDNSWDEAVDDAIQAIKKMYMDAEAPQRTKVMEKMQKAINEMPS